MESKKNKVNKYFQIIKDDDVLVEEEVEEPSEICKLIGDSLSPLVRMLTNPCEKIKMQFGEEVEPFGMPRIRIIEFCQHILRLKNPFLISQLFQTQFPTVLFVNFKKQRIGTT